jgi:hypothetical protein
MHCYRDISTLNDGRWSNLVNFLPHVLVHVVSGNLKPNLQHCAFSLEIRCKISPAVLGQKLPNMTRKQ